MARTVPAPVIIPNAPAFAIGRDLLASDVTTLGLSSNGCRAWGHAQNVVTQGFAESLLAEPAVLAAAHCVWRFPELAAVWTAVRCHAYAEFAGGAGNGTVRFQTGAGLVDLAVPPGAPAWYSGNCPIAPAAGYEEIGMHVVGDGVSATTVHSVEVEYEPLAGVLAAGLSDGVCPLDTLELDADSAVAADVGRRLIDNYDLFLDLPRVYYNWSGINGPSTIQPDMDEVIHRVWVPVHYGTREDDSMVLTVHVRATPDPVFATQINIHHGGPGHLVGHPQGPFVMTALDVANGPAVPTWYTATIRLREESELAGARHPMAQIAIWPGTRDRAGVGDFTDRHPQNGGNAGPAIHSVSVWGR
ncbi:MAG: hypothetical protein Q8Q14_00495 [Gemmatimonadales bacterium]|nr:hypothetical protein [Gemmatimonadales bacterium]